jgi:hypothetical protein
MLKPKDSLLMPDPRNDARVHDKVIRIALIKILMALGRQGH